MKYFASSVLSIFVITFFSLYMTQAEAICAPNEDWPQAPCLDVVINGCYDSKDVKTWMNYYDYKGESLMESKKTEMNDAIEENRLREWKSLSQENSNVWQYYYLKGEAPGFTGTYYQCIEKSNSNGQLKIQMNQSVYFDDYEIIFSEVLEDSRCPVDVICVWEGHASIKLDVKNKDDQNIILTTIDKTTAHFDSYKISLVDIVPYPVSTSTISQEEYSVTLDISMMDEIIPPIKQVSHGIEPAAVICKEELVLILKYGDESPACVKPTTVDILYERGWGGMLPPCCKPTITPIDSFEECVEAGNPVMESYPRQCRTLDGKHFVESVSEQTKCEISGGLWGFWNNMPSSTESCNPPTSDEGMKCTDSSQC